MKNRINRYNNGYIGNADASKNIAEGVVNLSKKNTVTSENYAISDPSLISYTRPPEWVSLPSFEGLTQYFAGVVAVYNNDTNFLTVRMDTSGTSYWVDWGDGTTSAGTDNQILYKNYTPAQYAGLTSSVYQNYKTALVQAYPLAGGRIEVMNLTTAHNQPNLSSSFEFPWLDVAIVGASCSSFVVSSLPYLERVNFIGPNSITSNSTRFQDCLSLRQVVNWDTSRCTDFTAMFRRCRNLRDVPRLDTRLATGNVIPSMFDGCFSLTYVPFFDVSRCTNTNNLFANCPSLSTAPPLNLSSSDNLGGLFQTTYSLSEIPWFPLSPTLTTMQSAFLGSGAKTFPQLDFSRVTSNSINGNSMFFGFRGDVLPNWDYSKFSNLATMVARSYTLQKAPDVMDISNATTIAEIFYDCQALKEGPRFIRTGNINTDARDMFFGCPQLKFVPAFNTFRITSFNNSFISDGALVGVGFTFNYPTGQTWATSTVFNGTFNGCVSLREIGISDVSGISGSTYTTAYSGMFSNCFSLSSVGLSGISENFSISGCALGATALNDLYERLAVVGASGSNARTITVTGNWGVSAALGHNPNIATAKGWSVAG